MSEETKRRASTPMCRFCEKEAAKAVKTKTHDGSIVEVKKQFCSTACAAAWAITSAELIPEHWCIPQRRWEGGKKETCQNCRGME